MIVRCPNKTCGIRMSIHDNAIQSPVSVSTCPICKTKFKPYELFYLEYLSKKKNSELQEMVSQGKTEVLNPNKTEVTGSSSKNLRQIRAWLIVHDEQAPQQSYDLVPGMNICGRQPQVGTHHSITISTQDIYMSRTHFSIEVIDIGGGLDFVLKDCNSTNGTFIDIRKLSHNTREMRRVRAGEELYIEDDTLIQAGKTKIYFKTGKDNESRETVAKNIHNSSVTKTIIIQ